MVNVDPAIRPATQKPAKIFFRSIVSINASFEIKEALANFIPLGREKEKANQKKKKRIDIEKSNKFAF